MHMTGHWEEDTALFISKSCVQSRKKSEIVLQGSGIYCERTSLWGSYNAYGQWEHKPLLMPLVNLANIWQDSNANSFNVNFERATDYLVFFSSDVCGTQLDMVFVHGKGASYFVFKAEVELQLGKKIKALRSDRGGEYLSQEFKDYLSENGIVQNLTSPYTPQQNGVSEKENSIYGVFLIWFLTKKVDKDTYEIWHGKDYHKATMVLLFLLSTWMKTKVIVASEDSSRAVKVWGSSTDLVLSVQMDVGNEIHESHLKFWIVVDRPPNASTYLMFKVSVCAFLAMRFKVDTMSQTGYVLCCQWEGPVDWRKSKKAVYHCDAFATLMCSWQIASEAAMDLLLDRKFGEDLGVS
ncbi:retrotransposon protein, putative, ty1-copia subclass [Tanacetum coccineum]